MVDSGFYVAGGLTDDGATSRVEYLSRARWRRAPDLPIALHHAMGVTWRNRFVVLGGFAGASFNQASDRVFELRKGGWRELPRLRRSRGAGGAAVVGDAIYVLGGQGGGRLIKETERFDGERWRDVEPIPTPRDHLAVGADADSVYAVGGRRLSIDSTLATLERYDPGKGSWSQLPAMPTPRGGIGAVFSEGRVFVFGGEGPWGPDASSEVQAFVVAEKRWERWAEMPTGRHGIGVGALAGGPQIIVAVGGPRRGGSTSRVVELLRGFAIEC